jgi:hypothetical protein
MGCRVNAIAKSANSDQRLQRFLDDAAERCLAINPLYFLRESLFKLPGFYVYSKALRRAQTVTCV